MPMYNVEHSYPLKLEQKQQLAERITDLHATTFSCPKLFVQVKFHQQDASAHNHFVGGVQKEESINRIIAFVRSSASRTKEHYDKLAERIENAWYVVLGERTEGIDEEDVNRQEKEKKESSNSEKKAKELLSIAFVGNLVVREYGYAIPEAGNEGSWFKEYKNDFEHKAEMGDEEFKAMLEEVENRDDLKSWRA